MRILRAVGRRQAAPGAAARRPRSSSVGLVLGAGRSARIGSATMSRTRQRGLRLAYGSWKIICMRRRSARHVGAAARAAPCRCRRTRSCRAVGAIEADDQARHRRLAAARFADQREASRPWRSSKSTPSTACSDLARPAARARGSARAPRRRSSACEVVDLDELAQAPSGIDRSCHRRADAAAIVQPAGGAASRRPPSGSGRSTRQRSKPRRAARVEGAARRDRGQARHGAVDLGQPLARARRGRGIEPIRPDGVGMLRRCWITSRTGPISAMRPAYITATRSAVSAITPMSWVTSITAVPCSRQSRFSSAMICAWIETSSAVVGSSATIRRGSARQRQRDHHALAHAAGELVRIVVDALLGAGMPTSCSRSMRALARLGRADSGRWVWIVSIELAADRVERVERGQRVLEDRADLARRGSCASPRRAGCRCAGLRAGSRRRRCGPGGSSRPMMAAPVSDLPAPDSPTTPRTSPGAMSKRDVVDRDAACRAASGTRRAGSSLRAAADCGCAPHQRSFGLSASRSQSPSRFTASTSSSQRRRRGRP